MTHFGLAYLAEDSYKILLNLQPLKRTSVLSLNEAFEFLSLKLNRTVDLNVIG